MCVHCVAPNACDARESVSEAGGEADRLGEHFFGRANVLVRTNLGFVGFVIS